jgi:hypothetical protein
MPRASFLPAFANRLEALRPAGDLDDLENVLDVEHLPTDPDPPPDEGDHEAGSRLLARAGLVSTKPAPGEGEHDAGPGQSYGG